jgi:hypothetical protein
MPSPAQALRAFFASPRRRLALVAVLGGGLAMFGACSACGRKEAPPATVNARASGASEPPVDAGPPPREVVASTLWASAKEGEAEDLAALAVHEGAIGLVEAASDPALRPTALRAMGYARGWAQLPYLAKTAKAEDDTEAKLALDAAVELAARVRKAEDVEDASELKEGCEELAALAKDAQRARSRRVSAVRALRMMPCPKLALPTDLDAK